MGCAGSKSTPVVEANTDVIKNGMSGNGTLMQKVEDIVQDADETVTQAIDEIGDALKPSTPETQRATDSEESGPESADPAPASEGDAKDVEEMEMVIQNSDDAVEEPSDDGENEGKLPNSDDLDESTPALSDKPPTPMPEAVILNAQWPNIPHESKEKLADDDKTGITPMDPIEEEGRRLIAPNTDEATVIEILTIEITEIPVVDEATLNFENRENEKNDDEESEGSKEDDPEGENKKENNEDEGEK